MKILRAEFHWFLSTLKSDLFEISQLDNPLILFSKFLGFQEQIWTKIWKRGQNYTPSSVISINRSFIIIHIFYFFWIADNFEDFLSVHILLIEFLIFNGVAKIWNVSVSIEYLNITSEIKLLRSTGPIFLQFTPKYYLRPI